MDYLKATHFPKNLEQGHKRWRVWDPITHQLVLRDKYKVEKIDE